jgi:anti-sigma regulatory factor (Ser/Thr protein kinase)
MTTFEQLSSVSAELAAGTEAPGEARDLVRPLVADFAGDAGFRALLAVTELVTNAIRHAGCGPADRVLVRAERQGNVVRVEVTDPGPPRRFQPRWPRPGALGGRGCAIVAAIADRWGTSGRDRNCVWFEIDRP